MLLLMFNTLFWGLGRYFLGEDFLILIKIDLVEEKVVFENIWNH